MTKAELDSIKILPLEDSWYRKVKEKLDGIAKPLDGLGKFEHLIAQIGAIEKTTKISIQKKAVLVMCADNGVVEEQVSQSGKEVTLAVAKAMGVSVVKIREVKKIAQDPISLETPIGEKEDSHLGDFIEDHEAIAPDDAAGSILLREQIDELLRELTDRERQVLELRFGLKDGRPRTLEEVGKYFGVTRERIRQIEGKALKKLKKLAIPMAGL